MRCGVVWLLRANVCCVALDVTSGNPPADTEGLVTWQFVDEADVPNGPWKNNISGPTTGTSSGGNINSGSGALTTSSSSSARLSHWRHILQ